MAMTSLERLQKFRKTAKGKAAYVRWNKQQSGTLQRRAHHLIGYLVLAKKIPKPSELRCDDCGSAAEVYDHRDYTKPREVDPVCRPCNVKRGPGANVNLKVAD